MDNSKSEIMIKPSIRDAINSFAHDVEEKTGRPFNSFKWPNKLIYFHLINSRHDLYYKSRKQNRIESNYEDYNEVIPCIEMEEVDLVECPCAPASGCTFMRSTHHLPTFLSGWPTSVTNLKGDKRYDPVEWSQFQYKVNNSLEALNKARLFTVKNIGNKPWLYTYITKETRVKSVKLSGVPIDPMEMFLFPVCGEEKNVCDIMDMEFIIEKRLFSSVIDMTYAKLINRNNNTRIGDTLNDDRNAETSADERF